MVAFGRRKKHRSSELYSASADLIGGSEDLIDKILHYLPARSLIRFKSVSKQWNSLISNPQFCLDHTLENPISRIPSGFFFRLTEDSTVYSVFLSKTRVMIPSFPHPFNDLKGIVQSCNGLNLFRLEQHYCVCNIVTNQIQFVPFPNLYPHAWGGSTWFLAFDPLISSHYKIICIQEVKYRTHQFLIFSSETGLWKDTDVTTYDYNLPDKSSNGVYLQGAIYCPVSGHCCDFYVCYRFDVEAEKLSKVLLPFSRQYNDSCLRYFGEFNGHLHLVYVRDQLAKRINVLELDHVSREWFPKYTVQINSLISHFPEVIEKVKDLRSKYAFSILSVVRGEKEEDSALIMTIPGKVVSYNLKSKKFKVLSKLPSQKIEMDFEVRAYVFPFIPTLNPL